MTADMTEIKVISIVGARPNFIKLNPLHKELVKSVDHTIVHTGQHYDFEMSEVFFKDFDLPKPDFNLEVGSGAQGYQVAEMIKRIEEVLIENKYDLAIVYGDTNSTFAGAFASHKTNTKMAHVEAGLRSYDRKMPEETNRILTDTISDLLFAPTSTAVNNLFKENTFGRVIKSGDLTVEIVNEAINLKEKSKILDAFDLEPKSYILFTMHRAENTSLKENFLSILKSFEQLQDYKIIFPIHPRTKKFLHQFNLLERIKSCGNIQLVSPMGYIDFIKLLSGCQKLITDSGGAQKEAYLMSIPCITIRNNTEWVETVEEGWNVLAGTDSEKIVKYVRHWEPKNINQKPIFGDGSASKRILEEIKQFVE